MESKQLSESAKNICNFGCQWGIIGNMTVNDLLKGIMEDVIFEYPVSVLFPAGVFAFLLCGTEEI